MDETTVYIEAEINPTESEQKVKQAIENVFGNVQTKVQAIYRGGIVTAEATDREALTKLYNLLRRERIRAAARKAFFEGLSGKTISFCLNKQVAYAGHISFSQEEAESPLGPIKVRIVSENPRELIDWLTPRTP
jgi:predicted RNA binding protein with dsRBD fold (UPF0201 family)